MIHKNRSKSNENIKCAQTQAVALRVRVPSRRTVGELVGVMTHGVGKLDGAGIGVGGKGRWAAFAAPPRTEPACGRG